MRVLLIIPLFSVINCLVIPGQPEIQEVSIGGTYLKIAPQLSEDGKVILYTLDSAGTFHRYSSPKNPQSGEITYSVLKNGILAPTPGPYAIDYEINKAGDIVPKSTNKCIYKSDKTAFFIRGLQKMLIPVEIFYSGDQICYVYAGNLIYTEATKPNENQVMSLRIKPDKSCCGDVTLFLLKSNGVFARNPPDEFLPNGMKLKYQLQEDGSLSPQLSQKSSGLELSYETTEDGNLNPCDSNTHTLTTTREATKSYILGEGGVLAPVSEIMGVNKTVSYFYDGQLIHSSNQFRKVFTNSSVVYLTERVKNTTQTEVSSREGVRFECRRKRDIVPQYNGLDEEEFDEKKNPVAKQAFPYEVNEKPSRNPVPYAYDDNGKRIVMEPHISCTGKYSIFKVNCKGHMKRLDHHEEPESGFPVYFKVLPCGILVPILKPSGKVVLKYILQPNGSLIPIKGQKCSLKKAPASTLYMLLVKNLELVPCRVCVLKSNHVEVYYQDSKICTIDPNQAKDLNLFTTLYSPLCAIFNGKTTIVFSDHVVKTKSGSTWLNPNRSGESLDYPSKNLYLIGPNNTKFKMEPKMSSSNGVTVYEMDSNGVCHKSPKDDNKNLGLKSFMLLKDGILLQTNKTGKYIYLVDKHGDMIPCCYPDTKLQAPHGLTVKYLECKNGVFVPILFEALGDHIRFSYENHVIYWRRTYTISEIIERWGDCNWSDQPDDEQYHKENGCFVYFERKGDVFQRHPNKKVEDFMIKHTGFLQVQDSGTLSPILNDEDKKKDNCLEVQLQDNGNLLCILSKGKKPDRKFYLLDKQGSLVPTEISEKDGVLKFYRKGVKIGKQRVDCWSETSGKPYCDPMKLFEDPEPVAVENKDPQYVQIKFDEKRPSKWNEEDMNKCNQIRECMMEMVKKTPGSVNMDIQTDPELMNDIFHLMSACSKGKKREALTRVQRHLNPQLVFTSKDDACLAR